jgi:hypothetical protein
MRQALPPPFGSFGQAMASTPPSGQLSRGPTRWPLGKVRAARPSAGPRGGGPYVIVLPLLPPSHSPSPPPKLPQGQLKYGPAVFPAGTDLAAGAQANRRPLRRAQHPAYKPPLRVAHQLLPGQLGRWSAAFPAGRRQGYS